MGRRVVRMVGGVEQKATIELIDPRVAADFFLHVDLLK